MPVDAKPDITLHDFLVKTACSPAGSPMCQSLPFVHKTRKKGKGVYFVSISVKYFWRTVKCYLYTFLLSPRVMCCVVSVCGHSTQNMLFSLSLPLCACVAPPLLHAPEYLRLQAFSAGIAATKKCQLRIFSKKLCLCLRLRHLRSLRKHVLQHV
jgi:hypothetical protein